MGLLISLPWVQSLAVSFLMSAHPYLWNRVKAHFSSTLKFWNWKDKICKYFWASFLTSLGNKLWVLQSHVFCCNYCICAGRTHLRRNIQTLPNISSLRDGVGINEKSRSNKGIRWTPSTPSDVWDLHSLEPCLGCSLYLLIFRDFQSFSFKYPHFIDHLEKLSQQISFLTLWVS